MYDEIWTVDEARKAIEQGNRLYTLSASGVYGEVEIFEDGIRARPDEGAGDQIDELPPCGS